MVFEVEDNGHGMDPDTLHALRDKVNGCSVMSEVSERGGLVCLMWPSASGCIMERRRRLRLNRKNRLVPV